MRRRRTNRVESTDEGIAYFDRLHAIGDPTARLRLVALCLASGQVVPQLHAKAIASAFSEAADDMQARRTPGLDVRLGLALSGRRGAHKPYARFLKAAFLRELRLTIQALINYTGLTEDQACACVSNHHKALFKPLGIDVPAGESLQTYWKSWKNKRLTTDYSDDIYRVRVIAASNLDGRERAAFAKMHKFLSTATGNRIR